MSSAITLRITEIFFSLQGESLTSGLPTVFIRLTGCPLRCTYCDTAYAFHGGSTQSLETILSTLKQYPTHWVTVTGGEPLAQPGVYPLMRLLCDLGYRVSLETSGALPVGQVDPRVSKVMDIKLPDSGENERHQVSNYHDLTPLDQLKAVVSSRRDYEWFKAHLAQYPKLSQHTLLLSPCHPQLPPEQLAEWILEDGLPVRMQVQLHKVIWGDQPGK